MKKRIIFTILLVTTFLLSLPALAQKPTILVINSYHAEYPWVKGHNAALKDSLEDYANLSFFYMDTKRLPSDQLPARVKEALAAYYAIGPDLVVLTDDNALNLLGKEITNRRTPVVYLGINANPRKYFDDNVIATGVLERPLFKRSIVFIKELLRGKLDKCLVLFDSGTTAHAILDTVFGGKDQLDFAHTEVELQLNTTFDQWKAHVLKSKERGFNAIILGLYQTIVDNNGNHVSAEEIAHWTSSNSPVPMFGFWSFSIGKGKAIGGLVLAAEPQGVEAAKLARCILDGTNAKKVSPVIAEHGRFVFSRSEMNRWGLSFPPNFVHPGEELIFVD